MSGFINDELPGCQEILSRTIVHLSDSSFMTCDCFVEEVRRALGSAGVDPALFNSHSFRIVAVTTGLEDSLIKTLGRWESSAYFHYVKIPRLELANCTRVIMGSIGLAKGEPCPDKAMMILCC